MILTLRQRRGKNLIAFRQGHNLVTEEGLGLMMDNTFSLGGTARQARECGLITSGLVSRVSTALAPGFTWFDDLDRSIQVFKSLLGSGVEVAQGVWKAEETSLPSTVTPSSTGGGTYIFGLFMYSAQDWPIVVLSKVLSGINFLDPILVYQGDTIEIGYKMTCLVTGA